VTDPFVGGHEKTTVFSPAMGQIRGERGCVEEGGSSPRKNNAPPRDFFNGRGGGQNVGRGGGREKFGKTNEVIEFSVKPQISEICCRLQRAENPMRCSGEGFFAPCPPVKESPSCYHPKVSRFQNSTEKYICKKKSILWVKLSLPIFNAVF